MQYLKFLEDRMKTLIAEQSMNLISGSFNKFRSGMYYISSQIKRHEFVIKEKEALLEDQEKRRNQNSVKKFIKKLFDSDERKLESCRDEDIEVPEVDFKSKIMSEIKDNVKYE